MCLCESHVSQIVLSLVQMFKPSIDSVAVVTYTFIPVYTISQLEQESMERIRTIRQCFKMYMFSLVFSSDNNVLTQEIRFC